MNYPHLSLFVKRVTHSQSQEIIMFFFKKSSCRHTLSYKIYTFASKQKVFKMKFIGIIPARYASSRFPGKPLAMLGGKYVIEHVYTKVCESLGNAYVATDDERT